MIKNYIYFHYGSQDSGKRIFLRKTAKKMGQNVYSLKQTYKRTLFKLIFSDFIINIIPYEF